MSTIIGKLSLFTTEQMAAKKRFAEIDTELKRSGAIIDIGRLRKFGPKVAVLEAMRLEHCSLGHLSDPSRIVVCVWRES